jgi:ABC-type transporter Mla MlaB component
LVAPEEPRATSVRAARRPHEPSTLVLIVRGPVARADVPALSERVHALLCGSRADLVVCDVGDLAPDAVTVDVLARLQLTARRLGREVRLRHACGELRELLALIGLTEVVPCLGDEDPHGKMIGLPKGEWCRFGHPPAGSLRLESRRKSEEREPAGGIEEEGDPADPAG